MWRALVSLVALVASLSAASTPSVHAEREAREIGFELHPEGFDVKVYGTDDGRDQDARIIVSRDGVSTVYQAPAHFTDHSIAARFGDLGALDLRFGPTPGTRRCRGLLTFTGRFAFTGEGGYLEVDARHARGAVFLASSSSTCPPAGKKLETVEGLTGPSLEATARSSGAVGARTLRVGEYDGREGQRRPVHIDAELFDRQGKVQITHEVSTDAAPGAAFRSNVKARTATLRPPAPFLGDATLRPGPGGKAVWRGSLRMPVLGGGPVALTGPDFHASLTPASTWKIVGTREGPGT